MNKNYFFLAVLALFLPVFIFAQNNFKTDSQGNYDFQTIRAGQGETPADFMKLYPDSEVTNINPGIAPEGDFMLRSAFSTDGTKAFVVNGYTGNVTVFDFETMTSSVIEGLNGYPVDIAVTDDYAIIGCLGSIIYVVDLSDYSIVEEFAYSGDGQAVVVETSPDGNFAYVAFDVSHQLAKINLQTMEIDNTFFDFPEHLLTFSFSSTGGRTSFQYSRFVVSPDNNYLIVGDGENSVLFIDTETGGVDYSVGDIPDCYTVGLSGDGENTIAVSFSYETNLLQVFRIDNATHAVTGTVEIPGYALNTYGVAVNADGSKAYIGVSNNAAALVRFETNDFSIYSQNYSPFWIGNSPDHRYVVHGQNRFAIFDFETETFTDTQWGNSQSFGAVSPVDLKVIGYDPLRYEGAYFYDCNDPSNIIYQGKSLSGIPPEGDTPYRIAVSPDGTKAVTVDGISESITIIDMQNNTVDTILDMGENCWEVAITHDSHWAILGGYDLNTIKIVNLQTNEFVQSITTGQRPMMIEISPDDNYAYIGNLKGNSVSFIQLDGENSQLITTIPVGVIGLSYAAFGVKSGVKLDPTGQYLLVAASFDNNLQVINVSQQQIVATLPVGTFPVQIAFNATGDYAIVTNLFSDNYSVIHVDGENSTVVGTYSSGGQMPLRLAYNPVADEFAIINNSSNNIVHVDGQTWQITGTTDYAAYGTPIQIKYNELGEPLVLTMSSGNTDSYILKNFDEDEVILPEAPTFFDYCMQTKTAAVCMPGHDFVTVVNYDPMGLQDKVTSFQLSLFPDPVSGQLTIKQDKLVPGDVYLVSVFDASGKMRLAQKIKSRETRIDVSMLKPGIYVAKVTHGNKSVTRKFIKK